MSARPYELKSFKLEQNYFEKIQQNKIRSKRDVQSAVIFDTSK